MEAKARTPALEIIGGAYDHLAPLTAAGRRRLGAVSRIIHPPRLFPEALRRLNPSAELVPAPPKKGLREAADRLRRHGGEAAVVLADIGASPALLRKAAAMEKDGFRVSLHPALPLAEAARWKAGLSPGEGEVVTVAAEEFSREEWPARIGKDHMGRVVAVGFDGRVLWPARRLTPESLPDLARLLPAEGALFVMPLPQSDGNVPRPKLLGRGVAVTRALDQADEIGLPLLARGATPFYFPTIAVAGPEDPDRILRAVETLESFHGVILTSANAVERFLDAVMEGGRDLRSLAGRRVIAVGAKTAEALRERGLSADAVPADFRAEGLIALLEKEGVRGRRFLLPRAEEGRELLPERIRELGGEIELVTVYRTVKAAPDPAELIALHRAGLVDAVIFTSGSTFHNFLEVLGRDPAGEILGAAAVACIGPVTAEAIREEGYRTAVMPERSTVEELVGALEDYFAGKEAPF